MMPMAGRADLDGVDLKIAVPLELSREGIAGNRATTIALAAGPPREHVGDLPQSGVLADRAVLLDLAADVLAGADEIGVGVTDVLRRPQPLGDVAQQRTPRHAVIDPSLAHQLP